MTTVETSAAASTVPVVPVVLQSPVATASPYTREWWALPVSPEEQAAALMKPNVKEVFTPNPANAGPPGSPEFWAATGDSIDSYDRY
jgi:hypothetical protein